MKKPIHKLRWEQIADIWDRGIGETGDVRHEFVVNPVVFEFLGNLKGKIVLDAGCGNGYLSRRMAKTAKKVIAVDFTEKLILHAKWRSSGFRNIEYRVENIERLSLKSDLVDTTLCNMVLMDLEHLGIAVSEIARVTRKNGLIVIGTQHPCFENAHNAYPLKDEKGGEVGRVVTDYFSSGLVVDKYEGFPHYHWLMSQYLNAFAKNRLCIEEVREPSNKEVLKERMTELIRNHTPMFIIFKLRKLI